MKQRIGLNQEDSQHTNKQDQQHQTSTGNYAGASSVEVYGFVGWITSCIAYVVYMLWALIPESTLEEYGVTYYPHKWWAIAVPLWLCSAGLYVLFLYEGLNMYYTPAMDSYDNITDKHAISKESMGYASACDDCTGRIPPIMDIPAHVSTTALMCNISVQESEQFHDRLSQDKTIDDQQLDDNRRW